MISNFKKFFYPIIGLGFISVVGWVVILLKTGVSTQDFAYYWQNTAYWCYGYDLDSITAGSSLLKSAGPFLGVRILPPLRALANILIPGFLSYNAAVFYHAVCLIVISLLLIKAISDWIRTYYPENNFICALLALVIFAFPWYWQDYLRAFNVGGSMALCAILAAFYIEKNENLSALLICLSLIKPQIGGIFLIAVALRKSWRLLFKCIGIITASALCDYIYIYNTSKSYFRYFISGKFTVLNGIRPRWCFGR